VSNPSSFDLIERLTADLPLTPEKVSRILGTSLERDPEGDSPVQSAYAQAAAAKDSPYKAVGLRIPHPVFGSGGGHLNVTVKQDEGVDQKQIVERYGPGFETDVPSPRYPRDTPAYVSYQQPWGRLSFAITNDERRQLLGFIIKPK
jgi:hypothetical protein